MHADTLWLDVDRPICTVSWRGQLPSTDEQVVFVALVRRHADFESVRELALVEVHPRQDGPESHPLALLMLALGRLVRPELPRLGSAARRG